MKVLVACEESQRVCIEFRRLGHEAYSCDILPCSGGHPEWHIQDNVLKHLDGWDMIIAFPPCTHLAVSGAMHFEKKRNDGRQKEAIEFFSLFLLLDCPRVAVENPVNIISESYVKKWFPDLAEIYGLPRKPTQVIQPYYFGDPFEKKTCLWLKGLPELKATNIVEVPERVVFESGKSMPKWYADSWKLPPKERSEMRSKTFPGVAKAMAEQWGKIVI